MALTLNEFIGFETGGLEEATSIFGGVDATEATIVRSGARSLKSTGLSDEYLFNPLAHVASGGTGNVFGFGFYFTDAQTSETFLISIDDTSFRCIDILLQSDGDFRMSDNTGQTLITPSLTEDAWNYIELYWEHVDSGSWEVFVNGTSVGSASARDMSSGGTLNQCRLEGVRTGTWYYDDIYWLTGATSSADRLGDAEVFKYQSVKASVTPDDGGADLNTGEWGDAGETPLENTIGIAVYTTTGAGAVDSNSTNGSPEGPLNDPRIQGDIKGMKGIWNMRRGAGGGAAHYGLLGNNSDGTARTADFDPPTSYGNFFHLTEASGGAAGDIPLNSEYCRIGFETTGAQDFNCGDMWAMLLHVPPSITELGIKPPMWETRLRHILVR